MKIAIIVFVTLVLAPIWVLALPPDRLWSRTFGGSASDNCNSVQQTSDGGYILGGGTASFGAGSSDFWIVKTDANGDSLWSRTFGGSASDYCNSIQQTADGGYVLGGFTQSFGAGWEDYWLVKTDANGDSLWSRTFGGSNWDYCFSVQQTADGGYILGGYTGSFGAGTDDFWLVKTDANGDSLWSRTFGESSGDDCFSTQQTADGGYILGGYTGSFGTVNGDFWLVKTDANGDSLWSQTFGGIGVDECHSVQQTADGGYILAGGTASFGAGNSDFWLVKTDSGGDSLWSQTFGGSGLDKCYSVQPTANGGYILAGYTRPFSAASYDFWLVKTDACGDSLWSRAFGGSNHESCNSVQQTSDGGYILAGYTRSFGAGGMDFWLVKTGPDFYDCPVSPQIVVMTEGDNARISWFPITKNTFDCPISISHYLVFRSPSMDSSFYYLGLTTDTTYTDVGVLSTESSMFYQVIATTAP